MTDVLLSVRDIEASYGPTKVVFGVSLDVRPGEFVSIMGRNGMSKSTVIKSIMGMLPITGGSIRFRGEDIAGLDSFKIAQAGIGLVPEGRRVIPTLTVEENLEAFAARRNDSVSLWTKDRVFDLFPRLKERFRALGKTLSGGEQQMLSFGRALMTNPRLLIVDEATEGLSPIIAEEIWRALSLVRSEGGAAIVIDKNVKSILSIADRHVVLEKGRVVWAGSSGEFKQSEEQLQMYLAL
jgi:branched-chain amino acid transport system ATP-binding protein